jgi:hypothetical protein
MENKVAVDRIDSQITAKGIDRMASRKIKFGKYCGRKEFAFLCSGLFIFALSNTAHAQNIDDQIEFLLSSEGSGSAPSWCDQLEKSGAILADGKLKAFCDQVGVGDVSSAGGTSNTQQTVPGIIQDRLREAKEGENKGAENENVQELAPGFNIFLTAGYEDLDRDVTFFEDGYDSDIRRFVVGADYRFSDMVTAGLAVNYYNQDGDLTGGGDFENDSLGGTIFASLLPLDNLFIQATAGYAEKNYDRTRIAFFEIVDGSAPGGGGSPGGLGPVGPGGSTQLAIESLGPGPSMADHDGQEYSAGTLVGYDFALGNVTLTPHAGIDWIKNDFDGYRESGDTGLELAFYDTDENSLQSRLGVTASAAINTNFGVLVPQVNANWVHEFEDDQRTEYFSFAADTANIPFSYQDEEPDRNFAELGIGLSAVLPNGWVPFVHVQALTGHDYLDSVAGTIGLRIEL